MMMMNLWRHIGRFKSAEKFSFRSRYLSITPDLRNPSQPLYPAPRKSPGDHVLEFLAAAIVADFTLSLSGFDLWAAGSRIQHDSLDALKERRLKCDNALADLESLERDIDKMKKECRARAQKNTSEEAICKAA